MDRSELKLIHFDSTFYLPDPTPLLHPDRLGKDTQSTRVRFDHLMSIFSETNRDELSRVVKSTPATCAICNVHLADLREKLNHIFCQPHIDKFVKRRGSISNEEFAFWKNILEIFPESRKRISKQSLQKMKLASSVLDLPSLCTHYTVRVVSASERDTALCHFISASISVFHQVIVFVKDEKEAEEIDDLVHKKFPHAASVFTVTKWIGEEKLYHVCIDGPLQIECTGQGTIYLRPPPNGTMKTGVPDPFNALCAYTLFKSESSAMFINSLKDEIAFREFEKKFMHSDKIRPLSIFKPEALRFFDEIMREETEKIRRTITSPHLDPEPIATVLLNDSVDASIGSRPRNGSSKEEKLQMRKEVCKVEIYCIELKNTVSIPEERSEKKSVVNEIEEKKWPEIFIPFDEEMGKKVDEIIKMLSK